MTVAPQTGLFLDLDGTIADSLDAMQKAYRNFLSHHGCIPSKEEFNKLNGPSLPEIVLYLKNKHRLLPSVDALLDHYNQLVLEAYAMVVARPGAERLINAARSRGVTVAIVTSNSGALAQRWLRQNGLLVDVVVGREDAALGKPHPDLYVRALKDTGCAAKTSVAVEDSEQGLKAALAAGIATVFFCGCDAFKSPNGVTSVRNLDDISAWIENERF